MCILASRMVHLRFVPFLFASWSFACALGSVDIFRRSDATGISVSTTSAATSTLTLTPTETLQTDVKGPVSLPPIGSYPRDFSPAGLQRLWSFIGFVTPPPLTTTPIPSTPIPLPTPPPALYPSWYAPTPTDIFPNLKFPKGFKFGVATAAYQVEGAAKSDGKGPTMWDWGPRVGAVDDGTNGDVVDLQYYLYKEDTARLAALGVNAHSFSISWARIYPFGVKDSPVNQAGLKHYSDLIDYSLSLGVEPVVTLYHWDTPLAPLLYYGGFASSEIVDDFVNYATTVFKAYNGKVKTWYTFNEPLVSCSQIASAPFNATVPPGVGQGVPASMRCMYNLRKAHAGAVKAFRALNISGEISFKNSGQVGTPLRENNPDDARAVERNVAFGIGLVSTPIYDTGDWPDIVKETLPESILPRFTEQEKKDIKGSADFFAIDAYTSQFIQAPPNGFAACLANKNDPLWPSCTLLAESDLGGWPAGIAADAGTPWLMATPTRLRYELKETQKRWPTKKIYIAEFGFAQPSEGQRTELFRVLDDADRTNYFMTYLGESLLAIHEDGVPLAGTFSWSMLDNAEWSHGTSTRFGIQYVNYTTLERVYKRSAIALSEFFKTHLE